MAGTRNVASAQVTALKADSQVLVIGMTEQPQACVKADQAALDESFDLKLYMPLPDYASRRVRTLASAECSWSCFSRLN